VAGASASCGAGRRGAAALNTWNGQAAMTINIFRFWKKIKAHETIHPADQEVFGRVGQRGHGLDLRCLPCPFGGPLKTAPVVLLFLSPGFDRSDLKDARTPQGRRRYVLQRAGLQPLQDEGPTSKWLLSRTKAFGIDYQTARRKIAVLNIGAYHSKNFADHALLAALPSSRVSLEWAQDVLFPQAMRKERAVVCLRASHFWGLAEGMSHGFLFVPSVTRAGHMKKSSREQQKMRQDIIRAVRTAITKL